ncbi:MAG TPA: TRAP transporter substrate-binding protein [Burkholderiaceae bacterium]|nr:TRAP transporter substrate-binding protein [Burkholderiaceae bacterium]
MLQNAWGIGRPLRPQKKDESSPGLCQHNCRTICRQSFGPPAAKRPSKHGGRPMNREVPNRQRRATFAWAAAATVCLGLGAVPAVAQDTLRIVGNFPTNHSSSVAMTLFESQVEKASNGKIKVDVFPAMQLGGAQENVDQVRSGSVFLTWISTAYLSRTVPELAVLSIPFLNGSREQAFRMIDGKVGDALSAKLAAKGFVPLGYMELGARQLTNNVRPVKSLADLKGLKIRLQPDETHLATFRALGANPTTMDIKEVYSALQQGVLDAEENPYAVIRDRNFDQVQKYISDTGHFFDFIVLVANKRKFDALKPELQKVVREAAAQAVAAQRKQAAQEDLAALEDLRKRGMQFDPVSPAFRDEMRKATAGIVDSVRKKAGNELVDAALASAAH